MLYYRTEREHVDLQQRLSWYQDNYGRLSTKYFRLSDRHGENLEKLNEL